MIENFVNSKLNLKLNPKSRYYPSFLGINFCGYILYDNYKILRKRSIKGMMHKIKLFNKGIISFDKLSLSFVSWCGHAKYSNCYELISSFDSKISGEGVT